MNELNFKIPGQEDKINEERKKHINELEKLLKASMADIKENKLKITENLFEKESSREVRLLASELIKNYFGLEFWGTARKAIELKSKELVEEAWKREKWVTGREMDPIAYGVKEERIINEAKLAIKTEMEQSFLNKMVEEFKKKFNRDESGHLRIFSLKTEEEISRLFVTMRLYRTRSVRKSR
jgi:hypothetical protein